MGYVGIPIKLNCMKIIALIDIELLGAEVTTFENSTLKMAILSIISNLPLSLCELGLLMEDEFLLKTLFLMMSAVSQSEVHLTDLLLSIPPRLIHLTI